MVKVFGCRTLGIIISVYSAQGFRSFSYLAIDYYLKVDLGLEPHVAQSAKSTTYIPWNIKPIYGLLSDSFPIMRRRRKPYFIIMGILGVSSWIAVSFLPAKGNFSIIIFLFTMCQFTVAFSDVIADAVLVEEARKDPVGGDGNLQSISWMSNAFMGLIGAIFGGIALTALGPSPIFLISSLGPLILLPMAFLMVENPVNQDFKRQGCVPQLRLLCVAFTQPIVWKSALWIFLSKAVVPGYSTMLYYFQTNAPQGTSYKNCFNTVPNFNSAVHIVSPFVNETVCETLYHNNGGLGFDNSFLGIIKSAHYLGMVIGTFVYNWKLKHFGFRKMLFWTQVVLIILSLGDLILVSRINHSIGLPDKIFVLGTDVISDIITQVQWMPLMVLCAKICPENVEATLFALLMSVSNASSRVSLFVGSAFISHLSITKTDFKNLWLLCAIASALSVLPIIFIFLIPDTVSQEKIDDTPQREKIPLVEDKQKDLISTGEVQLQHIIECEKFQSISLVEHKQGAQNEKNNLSQICETVPYQKEKRSGAATRPQT